MTATPTNPTLSTLQTIRTLRQQGDLRGAYSLAKPLFESDPTNLAYCRALAWVYVDRLKEAAAQPTSTRLMRGLQLVAQLPMPISETLWREQVLWVITKFMLRTPELALPEVASLVAYGRGFVPEADEHGVYPLVRSVWFKALLKHGKIGIDWLGLLEELGWEGFRPEDFRPDTFGAETAAGQPLAPQGCALVERVYMAAARQLLTDQPLLEERTLPVLERLQAMSRAYPDWRFMPYYMARLLAALGRQQEALATFLPFVRQKMGEFWVWGMMAELVETDEQQLACLYRAVSGKTPSVFLVKVRQQLAARLVKLGRWAEVRGQVEKLVETRLANNWPIPRPVQEWMNDPGYTSAETATEPGPEARYPFHELLWGELPEQVGLVVGTEATHGRLMIAVDNRTVLLLNPERLSKRVVVGERIAVRYTVRGSGDALKYQIRTAQLTDAPLENLRLRSLVGPLRRVKDKPFGFVQDVLVGAELLAASGGLVDQLVRVEAYEAWDNRRNQAGWRAMSVHLIQASERT